MLLTPRQDSYSNNINNNNMNLSPHHHRHHHHDDNNSLGIQLAEQLLSGSPKCYSPRPGHRSKLPPHIKICPPDEHAIQQHYLKKEDLDNDVFQAPTSTHSPNLNSDEKHEVYSGRLYIVRHTGNASSTSSPTRSPASSPSRSSATSFPVRSSPPLSTQRYSPQSSPTLSRALKTSHKTPVFVRVYRCNLDHFAVITRDVLYSNKPVYINLRHSKVIPGECLGRFIVAGSCDSGNVIEFETPELSSLGQWLDAFHVCTPPASPSRIIGGNGGSNTPPIPRSPALPTLTETDEEN